MALKTAKFGGALGGAEPALGGAAAPENAMQVVTNTLAAFSGMKLFDVPEPTSTDLFPQVKIPYPIEMGETFKAADLYQVGVYDGTTFVKLVAPFTVTVIAGREATRKLIEKPGKDGKMENVYERAYKPMGAGYDKSGPLFEQHMQDPLAQRGVSMVVAVISNDGAVAIVELPAFKVMRDYWLKPLHQARVQNRAGILVASGDHSGNTTANKSDPTKKYLDPKKFTAWKTTELSDAQLGAIGAVLEAEKARFESWSKQ
jgi:hypothetical protein